MKHDESKTDQLTKVSWRRSPAHLVLGGVIGALVGPTLGFAIACFSLTPDAGLGVMDDALRRIPAGMCFGLVIGIIMGFGIGWAIKESGK
jgi:hypothetical protein